MISLIGKTACLIGGYLLTAISLIPLIRNDNWIFRIFEYPRAQKLLINILLLGVFLPLADFNKTHDIVFLAVMSANLLYLFWLVKPYTPLSKHQLKSFTRNDSAGRFSLFICNVFQDNRDAASCLRQIEECDPDLVLLVETDAWWADKLKPLEKRYPYTLSRVQENTYGMMLYSKLELIDPRIRFLVTPEIPSILTQVKLPSGEVFKLYGLHPQPPVPQENTRSTERDAEILIVGKETKKSKEPTLVAGDLNDVAWSYTTALFMKISGLLDPRRGRGFYNTFHAEHWFLRWPLDHIFCSSHFQLVRLERMPYMGSDHFPMLVELIYYPEEQMANKQEELHSNPKEEKMAEEKINEAG